MIHVAIILPIYARALRAGEKTIEARLTRNRIVPFGVVRPGERVYFKEKSGGFVLAARVERVEEFADLGPRDVRALRARYNGEIGGSAEYWSLKRRARYATLVMLGAVEAIEFGPAYRAHATWRPRTAWFALPEEECVYPGCLRANRRGATAREAG